MNESIILHTHHYNVNLNRTPDMYRPIHDHCQHSFRSHHKLADGHNYRRERGSTFLYVVRSYSHLGDAAAKGAGGDWYIHMVIP